MGAQCNSLTNCFDNKNGSAGGIMPDQRDTMSEGMQTPTSMQRRGMMMTKRELSTINENSMEQLQSNIMNSGTQSRVSSIMFEER